MSSPIQRPSAADLKSGFLVFLIAMPLCLGISLASGTPPTAGVLTAICGGLISSFIGGSRLTIKGPAAGLIGIVLAAVMELGGNDAAVGYPRILAIGVAAALLQILFAQFKLARFGAKVPAGVVHGMLAAIGVIIISKQAHVLLGVLPHSKTPLQLLAELPESFAHANPEITSLGIITLALLFVLPLFPLKAVKKIPAAVLALMVVMPLSLLWHLDEDHTYVIFGHAFAVGPKFLVNLPSSIVSTFRFPEFSILSELLAWKHVLMFALIGSIESVLTVVAIDSIDPLKRKSNPNSDLRAVGVANLVSSFIGGLPMISEVVRSKANIDNGATSQWSNAIHGVFLLVAVAFGATVLHEIPLSALAGMLIFTGLRLASPKQFVHALHQGRWEFAAFVTTLLMTLLTDLLIGVCSGLAVELIHAAFAARSRKRGKANELA